MARKRGQGSKWCAKDKRLAIYLRDGCECAYCGEVVIPGVNATLDHLLACELGGTNEEQNLVTACLSCNSAKQALTMRKWFAVLRANGKDAKKIGARIRRITKRDLKQYRIVAKLQIAKFGYAGACEAILNSRLENESSRKAIKALKTAA